MRKSRLAGSALLFVISFVQVASAADSGQWTAAKANQWYASQPWLVGSNFIPSTAINELEMWQADTFDPATIDRELGWAESIGMNTMRVFLHNLPWTEDPKGFSKRIDKFLEITDEHHIRITLVLLDSVWDPYPKPGKQRAPKPHVHNSGWVQAPGAEILRDPSRWEKDLKPYVAGVLTRFRDDKRVEMWDLMNEPDNENSSYRKSEIPNKAALATELLKQEWKWATRGEPFTTLDQWCVEWRVGD